MPNADGIGRQVFIQDILFCTIGAQRVICNKEPLTDLPMQIIIKSIKITRSELCNTLMYFLSDCQISLGIEDMTKFNAVSIIRFSNDKKVCQHKSNTALLCLLPSLF